MNIDRIESLADAPKIEGELKIIVNNLKDVRKYIKEINETELFNKHAKTVKELQSATDKLNKVNAEYQKINNKLIDTQLKEEKLRQLKLKGQKAEESQQQRTNKAKQDELKINNAVSDEYGILVKAVADAERRYYNYAQTLGKTHPITLQALADARALKKEMVELRVNTGNFTNNVGNYGSAISGFRGSFDGLGMSVSQLTREFPAFTYSIQTGFLALSNNIPIFFDQIKQTNREIVALREQGQKTTGLMGRLAKSFFSFGTVLSIGITLLTVYGKEIGQFFQSVTKGKEALAGFEARQRALGEAIAKSNSDVADAVKNILTLEQRIRAAKDGFTDKKKAVDAYNDSIGEATGKVNSLEEAEKRLNKISTDYIRLQLLKAISTKLFEQAADKLAEKYLERYELEQKLLKIQSGEITRVDGFTDRLRNTQYKINGINKDIGDLLQNYRGLGADLLKDMEMLASKIGITELFPDPDKDKNNKDKTLEAIKEAQKEWARAFFENELKFQKTIIENENATYQERLTAADNYFNTKKAMIDFFVDREKEKEKITAEEITAIEEKKLGDMKDLYEEYTGFYKTLTKEKVDKEKDALKESEEANKDYWKSIDDLTSELSKTLGDEALAKLKEMAENLKEFEKLNKEVTGSLTEAWQNFASELVDVLEVAFTAGYEKELNSIEKQIEALEIKKNKDIEVAQQTITNAQEREAKISEIEIKAASDKELLERKQRNIRMQQERFNKAAQVFNIGIDTIKSVAAIKAKVAELVAASMLNPFLRPLIPIASAQIPLTLATGAASIAAVLAKPIPAYAKGTGEGGHKESGPAILGDAYKHEAIILPDGRVYKSFNYPHLVSLPKGAIVKPDFNTFGINSAKVPEYNLYNTTYTNDAAIYDIGRNIVNAVKNKKEYHISTDNSGNWNISIKEGSTFRKYLNNRL